LVTEESVKYKAEDLILMLRDRYEHPNAYGGVDYVVLEQVPNSTGFQGLSYRWIDAAVFSLIPSKGISRSAFEVKVSRSDLIRELQNPVKHKWCQEYFHEFWFLCPKDIVQVDEIPNGIGLMCPHGDKLTIRKHCQRNDNPKLDDTLLSAFMRSAYKAIEGSRKVNEQSVLDNCKDFQRSKLFQSAVQKFCEKRKVTGFYGDETEDLIVKKLEEATMDKQVAEDREYLLQVADHFQRKIASLFQVFAMITHQGILERDELGKLVVNKFGGSDESSLKSLKESTKKDKYGYQRHYAELVEMIANWDKEV
jgi:hypothetical protein